MSTEGHIGGGDDEDRALVAEFVLGLLDPEEHERMARRIAADPALQRERQLWQSRLSSLDGEFGEEAPPAHVYPTLEARLFGAGTRQAGLWARLWNDLNLWRGLAAGGLAVALAAVGFNLLQPAPLDPGSFATQLVAALEEEGSNVRFLALYDSATGMVRLTALSGEAVPDRDYELWAIEGDRPAVSLGVIPIEERIEVEMAPEMAGEFGEGTVLAITLEPRGGSPTGVATGPIVAKGEAHPI